jgi:PAS domain S-box-containing protein
MSNRQVLINILVLISYFIGLVYLYPHLGIMSYSLSLLPVIVSALSFGQWGGVATSLFIIVGNYLLISSLPLNFENFNISQLVLGGLVTVITGYYIGVNKRKSDELLEAQKRSETLRLGIEVSENVVFITDVNGFFKYINPAFTKIYGYTKSEVKGKTPRILKSGLKDKVFYDGFWRKIKSGEKVKVDMTNKTKAGEIVQMEASVNPILGTNGEIEGFLAIQTDVTEEKKIEEDLEKRAKEMSKLNELMVGREIKMIELKNEIDRLKKQVK